MDQRIEAPASFEFGRFRIVPRQREVLADGRPMRLGGRALDVLVALLEADGAVVGKDQLMRRVWPGRIVEDNNLHAQIRALRKAFAGHDVIRTVVGRGYQFRAEFGAPVAASTPMARQASLPEAPGAMSAGTNLPAATSDLIGRDEEIRELLGLLSGHRLVTLTGAGG